jgi:hypothetical protein
MKAACPLHGPLRHSAAPVSDQASALDQVDWAGLPINLDLAFSRVQRDKVYVQHVMRKQGSQLWRRLRDGSQPCTCESAEDANLHPDAAKDYV